MVSLEGSLITRLGDGDKMDTDPLKNKFWYCPKCGKLNLGGWCPCKDNPKDKEN